MVRRSEIISHKNIIGRSEFRDCGYMKTWENKLKKQTKTLWSSSLRYRYDFEICLQMHQVLTGTDKREAKRRAV